MTTESESRMREALRAELSGINSLLETIPDTDLLGRMSLESRRGELERELDALERGMIGATVGAFDPANMDPELRSSTRDCIHGRHARKCQECDLVIMEDEHRHMANALCEIADIDPGDGPPVEFLVDEALAVHRSLLAEVAELRASSSEKTATIDRMVREVAES